MKSQNFKKKYFSDQLVELILRHWRRKAIKLIREFVGKMRNKFLIGFFSNLNDPSITIFQLFFFACWKKSKKVNQFFRYF